MNKLKIGSSEFELKNYHQTVMNGRPTYVFDILSTYAQVKPLITDNQTYIVSSTSESGDTSERDLSSDCVIFTELDDKIDNCTLYMSNYNDIELLQQTINDLLGE